MRYKIAVFIILIALLLGYLSAGLLGIQAHTDPGEMDTTAYLSTAFQIKETGGAAHFIQNCLAGKYVEATQHPAYLLALSFVADRSVHFFVRAKLVSYAIGFLFLWVYFFCVRRMFGTPVALIGLALLVSAATFINLSTLVACECLLVIFFLLFWFFASRGFDDPKNWLAAGFFAGAAFLTKSIAILALPVFFLSVFAYFPREGKLFSRRCFWGFFAVFFLAASPLLIRNVKVFHTPLYSDSSAVMWMDRWHDYYRADLKENTPSLSTYLKEHSASQMMSTFSKGLFVRDAKIISDGLKPFAFWESSINLKKLQGFYETTVPWQTPWAWGLCLLALVGLWRSRRTPAALIAAASVSIFLVFVAWYSKVFPGYPPTRLLYPILFFIYIYASVAVAGLLRRYSRAWIYGACGIFAIVYLGFLGTHFDWNKSNIQKSYTFGNPFVAELMWVDGHLKPGETMMAGTVFMGYLFYFEDKIRGKVIQWPQVDDLAELEAYIKTNSVRYGILDLSTVVYNLSTYRDYFDVGPKIGMNPRAELPAPFQRVLRDPGRPALYEIYEFSGSPQEVLP